MTQCRKDAGKVVLQAFQIIAKLPFGEFGMALALTKADDKMTGPSAAGTAKAPVTIA